MLNFCTKNLLWPKVSRISGLFLDIFSVSLKMSRNLDKSRNSGRAGHSAWVFFVVFWGKSSLNLLLWFISSTFHSFLTLGYGKLSFSLSRSTCPLIRTNPGSPSSTVTEAWLFPLASSLELSSESLSSSGPSSFHILEMLKRIRSSGSISSQFSWHLVISICLL